MEIPSSIYKSRSVPTIYIIVGLRPSQLCLVHLKTHESIQENEGASESRQQQTLAQNRNQQIQAHLPMKTEPEHENSTPSESVKKKQPLPKVVIIADLNVDPPASDGDDCLLAAKPDPSRFHPCAYPFFFPEFSFVSSLQEPNLLTD